VIKNEIKEQKMKIKGVQKLAFARHQPKVQIRPQGQLRQADSLRVYRSLLVSRPAPMNCPLFSLTLIIFNFIIINKFRKLEKE